MQTIKNFYCIGHVLEKLEADKDVDTVFLDFSKAFDTCSHTLLLERLKHHKIGGKIGVFIHDFLTKREQVVVVDGTASRPVEVMSGVPQGSCLGPVLFLLMVSSIGTNVSSSDILAFADDTRVLKAVQTREDTMELQNDLNKVYDWAKNSDARRAWTNPLSIFVSSSRPKKTLLSLTSKGRGPT